MNLTYYTHLHNKGLIVDRQKVVVSSTNWSENSITRARESGVLIESAEIAGYFAEVFDFDWSVATDPTLLPANAPLFLPGAVQEGAVVELDEEVHPADLA
jgi:phosphatidylserine/phosphatidylglycerophosphate/cardiolipin synthase-like enzyme